MEDKNKKIVVGLMPGGVDGFIVARKYRGKKIVFKYLIPNNKEEGRWAKKILPRKDLIFYNLSKNNLSMATLDLSGVAKYSDLLKKIKPARLTHLLVHHAVDSSLQAWSKRNNIKLIAADFKLAQKLENKIWFDKFLIKNSLPAPVSQIWQPKLTKLKVESKLVIQEPDSRGGEGTYFVNSQKDLQKLLASKKIKLNKKYLVRKFVQGDSYGATVFIDHNLTALSSLRTQCYGDKNSYGQKEFQGIQWLNSSKFNLKLKKEINKTFQRLGLELRKLGYLGYANIDFIVAGSKIYLIECNPRFAASTTQLLLFPEIISDLDMVKLYLENFLPGSQKKGFRFQGLPKSNFTGATLYSTLSNKTLIKNYYPAGVYRLTGNQVKFNNPDISQLGRKNKGFIFYSDTQPGEVLDKDVVVGLVISNFALYDSRGKLNKYGKILKEYFCY